MCTAPTAILRIGWEMDTNDIVDEGELDYMGFCGDMGAYSSGGSNYWDNVQTILDTTRPPRSFPKTMSATAKP
jgi:hypothetical protein